MGHEVASRGGEASSFPLSMEEVQSVHAAMLSELRHRSDVLRVFAFPYGLAGSICSYCLFSVFHEQSHNLPFSRDLTPGSCPSAGALGGHTHCCGGMQGWGEIPDHLYPKELGVLH